ncbi:SLAP domain-containing protein [Lactobacillus crispatus]
MKRVLLKKGTKHSVWNNGKTILIHGERFYQLGQNSYVKAVNAKLL